MEDKTPPQTSGITRTGPPLSPMSTKSSVIMLEAEHHSNSIMRELGKTPATGFNEPSQSSNAHRVSALEEHTPQMRRTSPDIYDDWHNRTDSKAVSQMAEEMRPHWDGHPQTWNRIYKKWTFYLSLVQS